MNLDLASLPPAVGQPIITKSLNVPFHCPQADALVARAAVGTAWCQAAITNRPCWQDCLSESAHTFVREGNG